MDFVTVSIIGGVVLGGAMTFFAYRRGLRDGVRLAQKLIESPLEPWQPALEFRTPPEIRQSETE